VKLLVVTNLYPPLHAGTFDVRCETVVRRLMQRGHEALVLTSSHGMKEGQRSADVERRLRLNGVFGQDLVTGRSDLQSLESHNRGVLRDVLQRWKPDLVYVWSLHGLGKSLLISLSAANCPLVFDIADHWLDTGLRHDPWLRFWNAENLPLKDSLHRRGLELSGQRNRIDLEAPTRLRAGVDRLPEIFDRAPGATSETVRLIQGIPPGSVCFCSHTVRAAAESAGFAIKDALVVHPGVPTDYFSGEVKSPRPGPCRLLFAADLSRECGALTALDALDLARQQGSQCVMSIIGRGTSDYISQLRSKVIGAKLPVEFSSVPDLNRDLLPACRTHDVFLHASEWDEPYVSIALQAMACGLPVLASNAGAAAEVFSHGETALTYSAGDASELAGCILRLERDTQIRAVIAEAGRLLVTTHYDEAKVIERIEKFLRAASLTETRI